MSDERDTPPLPPVLAAMRQQLVSLRAQIDALDAMILGLVSAAPAGPRRPSVPTGMPPTFGARAIETDHADAAPVGSASVDELLDRLPQTT